VRALAPPAEVITARQETVQEAPRAHGTRLIRGGLLGHRRGDWSRAVPAAGSFRLFARDFDVWHEYTL